MRALNASTCAVARRRAHSTKRLFSSSVSLNSGSGRPAPIACQRFIAIAPSRKCDLIMMAPHGYRHRISGLLLGSETGSVLIHSKVLVVR